MVARYLSLVCLLFYSIYPCYNPWVDITVYSILGASFLYYCSVRCMYSKVVIIYCKFWIEKRKFLVASYKQALDTNLLRCLFDTGIARYSHQNLGNLFSPNKEYWVRKDLLAQISAQVLPRIGPQVARRGLYT